VKNEKLEERVQNYRKLRLYREELVKPTLPAQFIGRAHRTA